MTTITNPADKQKLLGNLQEIDASLTRIAAERDLLKEIYEKMSEEFDLSKKLCRKLGKAYHKRDIATTVAETNELSDIYESVLPPTED